MNLEHLKTILWLRWTLTRNQIRRQGKWWAVIVLVILALALWSAGASFFLAFGVGVYFAPQMTPDSWMYAWDVLSLFFLGGWLLGLLMELQRTELLSPLKLLHLPLSLRGLFTCNYLTSLVSLSVAFAVPVTLGLSAALVYSGGWRLALLPIAAYSWLFMVTALSYQFQGWLAAIMINPRRRRTILTTLVMILVCCAQLPNLLNIGIQRALRETRSKRTNEAEFTREFNERLAAGQVRPETYAEALTAHREQQAAEQAQVEAAMAAKWHARGVLANQVLPIGWVAYSAKTAAEGTIWPSLLVIAATSLAGIWSLRRAYRSMIRLYTSGISPGSALAGVPAPATAAPLAKNWLEYQWPGVNQRIAAVAWLTLRSLSRSPESRLLLLGPILGVLIGGGMALSLGVSEVPEWLRPLLILAAGAFPLLTTLQLVQNQFGQDRGGFRTFVLSAADRWEILVGKNLALSVVLIFICGGMVLFAGLLLHVSAPRVLAVGLQLSATTVWAMLAGNLMSIWFPIAMASGSMKPASANSRVIFAQMGFGLLFPLFLFPSLLCLGAEFLIVWWSGSGMETWRPPVFLASSVAWLVVSLWFYRRVIGRQGLALQRREQSIVSAMRVEAE